MNQTHFQILLCRTDGKIIDQGGCQESFSTAALFASSASMHAEGPGGLGP